jgi:hypothetical protein
MEINKMLADLKAERDQIVEAIITLEPDGSYSIGGGSTDSVTIIGFPKPYAVAEPVGSWASSRWMVTSIVRKGCGSVTGFIMMPISS